MQQRFWPDAQPLVERLGREFFRQLPEAPGVYLMQGGANTVLYVGKAKNLRHRIGTYRVANPERMPRRTLRLLNLVERIAWEQCENEQAALQRESELLLALKPRFNRAGVWLGPKRFLGWRSQLGGLELAVMESDDEGWRLVGPLGAQAVYVHRALVRLLWCRLYPDAGLAGMPIGWFRGAHGALVLIPHSDSVLAQEASDRLSSLVKGDCTGFQQWLTPARAGFEHVMREEDLELVTKHLGGRAVATATQH